MSVASFIASQRTEHRVPHAKCCRWLGVSESWFYKWHDREPTARQERRAALDAAVKASFDDSGGTPGTYGSPRVFEDLIEAGWKVSVNTVAASMARQGLQGRFPKRRRRCLTRPDKAAEPIPDLVKRDFSTGPVDQRWCGDLTEIPTDEGKLHLVSVMEAASRRILGFTLSEHHDAAAAYGALAMAVTVRGGQVPGVIMHTDQGSEYTARAFQGACQRLSIAQSMGRPGSALDNAVIESWHSTLEFELRRMEHFATKAAARAKVAAWIEDYNTKRRHSACQMMPPARYEQLLAAGEAA